MSYFPLDIASIASMVSGRVEGGCVPIQRVVIDNRIPLKPGDLFVAIAGARFDGGDFAKEALAQGASAALLSKSHPFAQETPPEDTALIVVDNALDALQQLAASCRSAFEGTVVGITGSNGKTTVKEMLRAALGGALNVYASPLSWNSQVGVAMTLLQLDMTADIALIECGISQPGEMSRLAQMVRPDLGVFVNVGDAHREHLHDAETTAREKSRLFAGARCETVFVPADETEALSALRAAGVDYRRVGIAPNLEHTLRYRADGRGVQVGAHTLALPDIPSGLRPDVSLTLALAHHLGLESGAMERGIAQWSPAPMRLEMTRTPHGVFVLNDTYSADPESFDVALRTLTSMDAEGRPIAVVGALAQLGRARAAAHARVGKAVAEAGLYRLILVGADARDIGEAAVRAGLDPAHLVFVPNATQAAFALDGIVRRGDRVLVKASRPERLERVVETLFSAFGPAVAHIHLEKLTRNFDTIRRIVGRDVAVMPVVKSFGYGLDSVRLGRLFVQRGAEALAVAYADEAVLLREQGIEVPILVQNILPHELEKIVIHGLSAEVVDPEVAEALGAVARRHRATVPAHVKVDTGMGRCGLLPQDALATVRAVCAHPHLTVEGLMTHLACADVPGKEDFTRTQIARFGEFARQAQSLGARPRWIHAANTAGLVRFADARFSMVRSGIGLLGYADLPDGDPFEPVLTLTTKIVAIKSLPEGAPVGYGSTWIVPEGAGPRRIAVVAIGYNDGYPRHLSNKGWMRIHGHRCPVVGRVCMDVTMVDTTDVLGVVQKGDTVVVYGSEPGEPSLAEMAHLADTISYELLTRISGRVRRIFVGEISGQTAAR